MIDINPIQLASDQNNPVQKLVADIQSKNLPTTKNPLQEAQDMIYGGDNSFGGVGIQPSKQKFSLEERVPISQGYDLVAGDWMSKFPTYKQGRDNAEYAAQNQSTGEKWVNGLAKFGLKTTNAVVGGTYGILHGLGSAISDGNWSSIYDNNFSNWMSDLDTKLNYQLPNYYTKQEEQAGVFGQMGTANFWSDKFLGGLSFTAGAIISEGIWAWATGGTSLATTGARLGGRIAGLGRVGRWGTEALGEAGTIAGLAKTKGLYKALDLTSDAVDLTQQSRKLAVGLGRVGEATSIVARTARSAGYEASVEALQYKKEAEEKFYRNFADLNGREPSVEEIAKFEKDNESTANAVFGANMAIVSVSNFVGLGNVLNIKNPINLGINDFISKKAFGYGIDATTKTVLKGTMGQRVARNAFDYLIKPSVTEGLFEEGGQGVVNKTANKWIEHTYNPKHSNETFSQMEAFTESLSEQYGSEEGWKENMLGILIGIAGGSVNVSGAQKAKQAELEMQASTDRTYDNKTLQSLIIPHRVQTANRIAGFTEEADIEENKGNLAKSQIAKVGATTSYVNSKLVLGESISDMTQEMKGALDSMTSEQWKELGIEPDQIEQEKDERISEFKNLAQAWKTNKEYVQYMVGSKMVGQMNLEGTALEETFGKFSKNAQVVEALTWQLTVGEQSGKILEDVVTKVGEEIGVEHARTITTIKELERQTPQQRKEIAKLKTQTFANRVLRDNITKRILDIDKLSAQTESQKLSRNKLSVSLIEAEKKVRESEQKLQDIADKITASKNYKNNLETVNVNQNILTGQDLLDLDKNINKFKSVVEQQEELDPQRASYLRDLMQEHSDAYSMFMQAKATQKALTSKEFKIENIDGWVSNLFKKNKSMNENTQAWFTDAITQYDDFKSKLISRQLRNEKELQKEIDLQAEVESGKISQETLQSIADKTELSKTEQIIYNENKEVIDELRKQNNLKTKKKSQEQINQEKIDALEAERRQKLAEVENNIVEQNIDKLSDEEKVATRVDTKTEIDKINKEYDAKIDALKPTAKDSVEEYKKRIDNMFNNIYDDLIPTEDLEAQRPTKEEIEEYRNATNKRTKRFQELKKKLQNWQLLDNSSDDGYTSIVDLLDLITQLETEVEQETTKDEVTEEEAVEDVSNPDFGEGSNSSDEKAIPNNSTEPVVAHKIKGTTKIELSHAKAKYIVDQIRKNYKIIRNKKEIANSNIDFLEVGDIVEIDGMQFSMGEKYRLVFEEQDLFNRQQQLNLYVETNQNYLNFLSVYSIFGDKKIKTPSQLTDVNLEGAKEEMFKVKPGDILTLHVDDKDGWNKTKKGGTQDEFKIYLKRNGKFVSVLKSGTTSFGSPINKEYANIRLRAFQNWDAQGRPDQMDLGISLSVGSVLLTAPELLYSDGQLIDGDISIEETQKVIIGKGFIENGKITLDNEIKDVQTAYVGRLTKNNPNLKIPIVVFRVGENTIAFPITMKKSANPIEFDALFQGTPQEIVKKINQGIIDNKLKVNKLTFSDVTIDYNGEVILSESAQKVREVFINKTSFVSADTLADKKYNREDLVRDASIRIDLSNLEKVFSAPKVILDLSSAEIKTTRETAYNSMVDVENTLNNLVLELDKDYRTNASTKYVDSKGDIIENTHYTNTLDDANFLTDDSNISKLHNIKILREALSEKIPSSLVKAIGADKIETAKNLLKQYDAVKNQTIVREEDFENGKNNIC